MALFAIKVENHTPCKEYRINQLGVNYFTSNLLIESSVNLETELYA